MWLSLVYWYTIPGYSFLLIYHTSVSLVKAPDLCQMDSPSRFGVRAIRVKLPWCKLKKLYLFYLSDPKGLHVYCIRWKRSLCGKGVIVSSVIFLQHLYLAHCQNNCEKSCVVYSTVTSRLNGEWKFVSSAKVLADMKFDFKFLVLSDCAEWPTQLRHIMKWVFSQT